MSTNNRDSRFLRTEITSLNGRLSKFNQENDDLLQRLSELKVEKERREAEFELEKSELRERIRILEGDKLDLFRQLKDRREAKDLMRQGLKTDESYRMQIENMRQEHARRERELLHRMESLKNECEMDEGRMKKEIEQLKMTVQSKLDHIDEIRLENDRLARQQAMPSGAEERLREEIGRLKATLDVETRRLTDVRRENEELRKTSSGTKEETKRRIDELIKTLRYKEDLLDEANRQLKRLNERRNDDRQQGEDKSVLLRREFERMSDALREKERLLDDALAELSKLRRREDSSSGGSHVCDRSTRLERELDRLTSTLRSKEELLNGALMEKRQLHAKLEELQDMRGMISERDRLELSLRTKERVIDEIVAKNKEVTMLNDRLQKDLKETRAFLKNTSDANQELAEKCSLLEKALVNVKPEKEDHQSESMSPYLKNLLMKQESSIFDLQRQVTSLRKSITDKPKDAKVSEEQQQSLLLGSIAEILSKSKPKDNNNSKQLDEGILKELKQAKLNLDLSRQRILKLENWLDSMHGGTGLESVGRLKQERSATNGYSTKSGKSVLALPDILENDCLREDEGMLRLKKKVTAKNKSRPSWNSATTAM